MRDNVTGDFVVMLVGNKSDLRHLRCISSEEVKVFSGKSIIMHFNHSKNVENATKTVDMLFIT